MAIVINSKESFDQKEDFFREGPFVVVTHENWGFNRVEAKGKKSTILVSRSVNKLINEKGLDIKSKYITVVEETVDFLNNAVKEGKIVETNTGEWVTKMDTQEDLIVLTPENYKEVGGFTDTNQIERMEELIKEGVLYYIPCKAIQVAPKQILNGEADEILETIKKTLIENAFKISRLDWQQSRGFTSTLNRFYDFQNLIEMHCFALRNDNKIRITSKQKETIKKALEFYNEKYPHENALAVMEVFNEIS